MRSLFFLLMLTSLPLSSFSADLLVTWQDGEGNLMKLAHRDDTHVRMDMQPDSYMLLTGDKIYMVSKDEGEWQILDMDQVSGMAKMFGASAMAPQVDDYEASFVLTGKTEKVASYKGSVYIVEVRDKASKLIQKDEVVFSKHKDVRRASQAMMIIATKMGDKMGAAISADVDEAMQEARENDYGGTLRYGTDMKVVSIEKDALAADYFQLPQNAKQLEVGQPPAAQSAQGGGFFGQLLGDSESAAKDEANESTVEEVRKGVRGLFKNVFE